MGIFVKIKLLLELQRSLDKFQKVLNTFKKENSMLSFAQLFKSKTIWLNVITATMAGYGAIAGNLPSNVTNIVAAAGPILTIIFKIFFNQQASK